MKIYSIVNGENVCELSAEKDVRKWFNEFSEICWKLSRIFLFLD
jgi:hypothetical protein